jgi:hypothetical protein
MLLVIALPLENGRHYPMCTGKNTKGYIGPKAKFKDDFDFAGNFSP